MKVPRGNLKVNDFTQSPGVANSWLNAVGVAVSAYAGGPAASAYQSASQLISPGGPSTIIFDTIYDDLDSTHAYDKTTGIFQPKIAGFYQINTTISLQNINYIQLFYGSNPWVASPSFPSGSNGGSLSVITYIDTTHQVTIRACHTNATATNTTNPSAFGAFGTIPLTYLGISLIRPA